MSREMANTHMIVDALITMVALTAGFAIPGDCDGNQGPNHGSTVFLRKTTFQIFMLAETYGLFFQFFHCFSSHDTIQYYWKGIIILAHYCNSIRHYFNYIIDSGFHCKDF